MNAKFGPIGESMGSRQPVKTFRVCVVRIALGSFAILRLAHPSIALDHASSNNTNATDKILERLARFLGVDAKLLLLDAARTVKYENGAHYEFHQMVDHQMVENTLLIIDVARDKSIPGAHGRLVGVGSQLFPQLELLSLPDGSGISQEVATCIAAADFLRIPLAACDDSPRNYLGDDSLDFKVSATLFAESPYARPAWAVELRQNPRRASRRCGTARRHRSTGYTITKKASVAAPVYVPNVERFHK